MSGESNQNVLAEDYLTESRTEGENTINSLPPVGDILPDNIERLDITENSNVLKTINNENNDAFPEDSTDISNSDKEFDENEKISSTPSTPKPFPLVDEEPRLTEEDGWLDIIGSGDFKKRVIKLGEGVDTRPKHGNLIRVNYTCYDSSDAVIEQEENIEFTIGDLDVIQGLDLALALMEQGEKAEILVPSRLAYGKLGRKPDIPPDCDLRYEVEILKIEDLSEIELSISQKMQFGNKRRDRGNFWYGRGDYLNAIHCYERAAEYLDGIHNGSENPPEMLQTILDTRIKVYNNMAAAHLKLEAFDKALKSVDFVLKIQLKNVKAHFRKGKILAAKGLTTDAIASMRTAAELEPETKIIQQELSKLITKKKGEENSQKAMYKRMFGQSASKPKPSKAKMWAHRWSVMAGSCLAVAFGIVAYRQYYT